MRKVNFSNKQETERRMLNMQLKQQQSEIRQLDLQYKSLSKLQHDFNNKINCIHSLMLSEEYDKAIDYSEKLLGENSSFYFNFIKCSSSIVNAVVNSKFGKANEFGIKTSCRIVIAIPEYLEYDLSILLSNLLDNAIEACQKNIHKSHIILSISEIGGYYRITVKNTIDKPVLKVNNKLETRKADKQKHGWGLKSIYDITENYNGNMDIYEDNEMFVVDILLMKKEQKSAFGG